MISTIIIDDEAHCINALKNDLKLFCPTVDILATASSGIEGLRKIREHQPQLIFLDIEMPDLNGFELLELLGQQLQTKVIFTTAYAQFAIKALRINALDYLLKPVDEKELIKAIERVGKLLTDPQTSDLPIEMALANIRLPNEEQKIAIPNRDGFDFVHPRDIIYCQADGAYTKIFFIDDKQLLASKSLGEMETILPNEGFYRIHHSTTVNISHINQFKRSEGSFLIMTNGDQLTIARSKKEQLLKILLLQSK